MGLLITTDIEAAAGCERCGEQTAIIHTGHASLCEDCYSDGIREALQENGRGKLCCRFLTLTNGIHAICVEPYGTEHDHDA